MFFLSIETLSPRGKTEAQEVRASVDAQDSKTPGANETYWVQKLQEQSGHSSWF